MNAFNRAIEMAAEICETEADKHDRRLAVIEEKLRKMREEGITYESGKIPKFLSMREVAKKIRSLRVSQ